MNKATSPLTGESPQACRPLEQWVAYRFGLIAARMGVIGQQYYVKRHKLNTSAWRALAVIARFQPCSATELVGHSRLDAPKVSRAIVALSTRKLIKRTKDPEDQRRAVLVLTPLGRKTYDDIAAFVENAEDFVTATLTAQERDLMWRAIGKIDAQLRQHAEADPVDGS